MRWYAVPVLPGEHVTAETGTGFVHTAPTHGQEDFEAYQRHLEVGAAACGLGRVSAARPSCAHAGHQARGRVCGRASAATSECWRWLCRGEHCMPVKTCRLVIAFACLLDQMSKFSVELRLMFHRLSA